MFRALISLSLATLLLNLTAVIPTRAESAGEKEVRFAVEVKASVAKIGTGQTTRVKVQLRDKTKLEGYISAIYEEGFVVTNAKTGVTTEVAYAHVKSIKGSNLSSGAKVAIKIGVAVGILAVVLFALKDRINSH